MTVIIPDEVLIPSINNTLQTYAGKSTDKWGEEERSHCRRQCGAGYEHIETDWIHHRATNLRKAGKLESVNGGPKRKKWENPDGKYAEYLAGDHWQAFRKSVMGFWSYLCCLCASKADDVHHNTYARIGREKLTDCVPLCLKCHKKVHGGMEDGNEFFNTSDGEPPE